MLEDEVISNALTFLGGLLLGLLGGHLRASPTLAAFSRGGGSGPIEGLATHQLLNEIVEKIPQRSFVINGGEAVGEHGLFLRHCAVNQTINDKIKVLANLTLYALTGRIRPVLPKFQF